MATSPAQKKSNRKSSSETKSHRLPLTESIGYLLREADRAMESHLQSRLAKYQVQLGMWFYLRVLWMCDGMTQAEISKRVNATPATTALQLARMEQRGLIRRETGVADRRRSHVYLTAEGRALEAPLLREAITNRDAAMAGIDAKESEQLMDLLRRVIANLNK